MNNKILFDKYRTVIERGSETHLKVLKEELEPILRTRLYIGDYIHDPSEFLRIFQICVKYKNKRLSLFLEDLEDAGLVERRGDYFFFITHYYETPQFYVSQLIDDKNQKDYII